MSNTAAGYACRPSCSEILQHPWLKQEGRGSDTPLGNVVLGRMKKFAGIHQLKKTALLVVGSCLSAEEIAGMKRLFKAIDHDNNGKITVSELQVCCVLHATRAPQRLAQRCMLAGCAAATACTARSVPQHSRCGQAYLCWTFVLDSCRPLPLAST